MDVTELNKALGNMDIHLLDQVLKGRFKKEGPLLDAGCGEGRNLHYFLQEGFDIYIVDKDPSSIQMVQMIARSLNSNIPQECTFIGDIEKIQWKAFQTILLLNVIQHFENMHKLSSTLDGLFDILYSGGGGILFLKAEIHSVYNKSWLTREGFIQAIDDAGFHFLEPMKIEEIHNQGIWVSAVLSKK